MHAAYAFVSKITTEYKHQRHNLMQAESEGIKLVSKRKNYQKAESVNTGLQLSTGDFHPFYILFSFRKYPDSPYSNRRDWKFLGDGRFSKAPKFK